MEWNLNQNNGVIPATRNSPSEDANIALLVGEKFGRVVLAPLVAGDGSARLQAVLATCAPLRIPVEMQAVPACPWHLNTRIDLPDFCALKGPINGAIDSTLPSTGGRSSSIFSTDRSGTYAHATTLTGNAVEGAITLVLASVVGYAIGGFVSLTNGSAGFSDWSTYQILNIGGSTVTIDRPLSILWDSAITSVQTVTPAQQVDLDLQGATITAGCDRAIDFVQAWKCKARNFNAIWTAPPSGPAQNESAVAIDNASYDSHISDYFFDGNGFVAGCASIEGSEACSQRHFVTQGCGGFSLPSAYQCDVSDAHIRCLGAGAGINFFSMQGGNRGSRKCRVQASVENAAYGAEFQTFSFDNELHLNCHRCGRAMYLTGGSARNSIWLSATTCTYEGVIYDDTNGAIIANVFKSLNVDGATIGLQSNGGTATEIEQAQIRNCPIGIQFSGGFAHVGTAVIELNTTNAQALLVTSGGFAAVIDSVIVRANNASTAFEGIYLSGASRIDIGKYTVIGQANTAGYAVDHRGSGLLKIGSSWFENCEYAWVTYGSAVVRAKNRTSVNVTNQWGGIDQACSNWLGNVIATGATPVVVPNRAVDSADVVTFACVTPTGQGNTPRVTAINLGVSFTFIADAGDTSTYRYEF